VTGDLTEADDVTGTTDQLMRLVRSTASD